MTSGIIPPNPSELLSSDLMKDFFRKVNQDWDIVLFDTPPLVAVTDAAILSNYSDKIILVIMPGKTDKRAFNHCLNNLEKIDAPLKGLVFNGVNSKNSYGSYYYYYQYYNYYGTDSNAK